MKCETEHPADPAKFDSPREIMFLLNSQNFKSMQFIW